MTLTLSELLFCYVAVLLTGLAFVGLYSEFRRRRFEPTRSDDNVFRCENCAYVYTDDPNVVRSRCPHCTAMNAKFNF